MPLLIQEANVVPGRVNRLLARRANVVALPFEQARGFIRCRRIEVTGNAVRPDLIERFKQLRDKKDENTFNLFVFGGSQGARRLNEAVTAWAEVVGDALGSEIRIMHQTGKADFARVAEFYKSRDMDVQTADFIEDMAAAYAQADLVLSRAGGSVAELTALGLPAILAPYPYAADDHQTANAQVLEEAGAAVVIEDENLSGETLGTILAELRADPDKIKSMARASAGLGRPDAAAKIAGLILEMGGNA